MLVRDQLPPTTPLQTTYWTQAKALFRKNGKQQLRSWKVNLGLLSCAIIFPLLMLVAQIAINNAISGNGNGEVRHRPACRVSSMIATLLVWLQVRELLQHEQQHRLL